MSSVTSGASYAALIASPLTVQLLTKAGNSAVASAIPILATILAFLAYTALHENAGQSPATIFTSLCVATSRRAR